MCKPAVASILASLWNEDILDTPHQTLQDTNDRFLANMQRGGSYSVVPRVPGGEITPEKLIVLGEVAKEYGLYTKITGGQRIDLFGAQVQDLPDIWEATRRRRLRERSRLRQVAANRQELRRHHLVPLRRAGFGRLRDPRRESLQGNSLAAQNQDGRVGLRPRMCRSAVQGRRPDRHGERLQPLRLRQWRLEAAPRRPAGDRPRRRDGHPVRRSLSDVLHQHGRQADAHQRLARKARRRHRAHPRRGRPRQAGPGRRAGSDDRSGWSTPTSANGPPSSAIRRNASGSGSSSTPTKRSRASRSSPSAASSVPVRGLPTLSRWNSFVSLSNLSAGRAGQPRGFASARSRDFPKDGGAAIKYGRVQIAVFNFTSRGEWYACQNMCPHKKAFVLSRGIVGDAGGVPKVACPLHKKTFSLVSGESLQKEEYRIRTFPVRVEGDDVYLDLPPTDVLDQELATEIGCRLATSCESHAANGHVASTADPVLSLAGPAGGGLMLDVLATSDTFMPRQRCRQATHCCCSNGC